MGNPRVLPLLLSAVHVTHEDGYTHLLPPDKTAECLVDAEGNIGPVNILLVLKLVCDTVHMNGSQDVWLAFVLEVLWFLTKR